MSSVKLSLFSARAAIIAAVYAAVTIVLGPLAYGEIQVRITDAMLILPLLPGFGWDAVVGLTIGGFLANLASPFGYIDWVFGPTANFLATIAVYGVRRITRPGKLAFTTASILAIIIIAIIIGFGELHLIFNIESIVVLYVLIGEAISVGIGGGIIYFAYLKRIRK